MQTTNFFVSKFLLVLLVALFDSCGKDEILYSVVGSWELENVKASECTKPSDNSSLNVECTLTNCTIVKFNADGSGEQVFTINGVNSSSSQTYTISGGILKLSAINGDFEFVYSVTSTVLTLKRKDKIVSSGCRNTYTYSRLK